jgi:hypothetical protein
MCEMAAGSVVGATGCELAVGRDIELHSAEPSPPLYQANNGFQGASIGALRDVASFLPSYPLSERTVSILARAELAGSRQVDKSTRAAIVQELVNSLENVDNSADEKSLIAREIAGLLFSDYADVSGSAIVGIRKAGTALLTTYLPADLVTPLLDGPAEDFQAALQKSGEKGISLVTRHLSRERSMQLCTENTGTVRFALDSIRKSGVPEAAISLLTKHLLLASHPDLKGDCRERVLWLCSYAKTRDAAAAVFSTDEALDLFVESSGTNDRSDPSLSDLVWKLASRNGRPEALLALLFAAQRRCDKALEEEVKVVASPEFCPRPEQPRNQESGDVEAAFSITFRLRELARVSSAFRDRCLGQLADAWDPDPRSGRPRSMPFVHKYSAIRKLVDTFKEKKALVPQLARIVRSLSEPHSDSSNHDLVADILADESLPDDLRRAAFHAASGILKHQRKLANDSRLIRALRGIRSDKNDPWRREATESLAARGWFRDLPSRIYDSI